MPSFMIVRLQTSEIKRGQTDKQTDKQTNRQCDLYIERLPGFLFLLNAPKSSHAAHPTTARRERGITHGHHADDSSSVDAPVLFSRISEK